MQPGKLRKYECQEQCVSKKWSLVSLEPLDPNSAKVDGFYKANNFVSDIAFGTSLFVFCDLKEWNMFQIFSYHLISICF